jgi:hypothetical protein
MRLASAMTASAALIDRRVGCAIQLSPQVPRLALRRAHPFHAAARAFQRIAQRQGEVELRLHRGLVGRRARVRVDAKFRGQLQVRAGQFRAVLPGNRQRAAIDIAPDLLGALERGAAIVGQVPGHAVPAGLAGQLRLGRIARLVGIVQWPVCRLGDARQRAHHAAAGVEDLELISWSTLAGR